MQAGALGRRRLAGSGRRQAAGRGEEAANGTLLVRLASMGHRCRDKVGEVSERKSRAEVAVGPCEYGAVETSVDAERDGCRWLEASKGQSRAVQCGFVCVVGHNEREDGTGRGIIYCMQRLGGRWPGPQKQRNKVTRCEKLAAPRTNGLQGMSATRRRRVLHDDGPRHSK